MAGAQTAWGLDVGLTSLKAIKLRRDGDMVSVEAFDVVEHDKFLSEPDVDRDAMIQQTLQKFLLRNPIRRERVYIGVPGSSTFARFVKLPPVDPKKIPEIVKFEAIQQIPFPLDQVNWDYHTFQSPESPDVEVGIFAMKKELVAQVLSNFRAAGLTIHGVQMSPLAVYNAAAYDGLTDDKGTVLIDMGAEHTDLVIMDQGRLWLRTINIGGNHFTDALAKSFKQSFSKAETLKKGAATSKYQKQIFQAMRPIFADLVADIQRSIGHYNSSHRDSRLERIVGMGNPFKLPNLQKYLQQELKMEVIRLDNFRKMKTDPKLGAGLNENILGMTAAYGLAIQGLGQATIGSNLLPIEIARQMMWKNKQPWFIGAAAILVLAIGGAFVQYYAENKSFANTQLDEKDKNNNAMVDAINAKKAWPGGDQFTADKAQIDQILGLEQARTIWPALTLDLLTRAAPGQKSRRRQNPRLARRRDHQHQFPLLRSPLNPEHQRRPHQRAQRPHARHVADPATDDGSGKWSARGPGRRPRRAQSQPDRSFGSRLPRHHHRLQPADPRRQNLRSAPRVHGRTHERRSAHQHRQTLLLH